MTTHTTLRMLVLKIKTRQMNSRNSLKGGNSPFPTFFDKQEMCQANQMRKIMERITISRRQMETEMKPGEKGRKKDFETNDPMITFEEEVAEDNLEVIGEWGEVVRTIEEVVVEVVLVMATETVVEVTVGTRLEA